MPDRWPEDDFSRCAWCGEEYCDCPEREEHERIEQRVADALPFVEGPAAELTARQYFARAPEGSEVGGDPGQ